MGLSKGLAVAALALALGGGAAVPAGGSPGPAPLLLWDLARTSPDVFHMGAVRWLRKRWQDGQFPPHFHIVDVPSARSAECGDVARGWMTQLELDVLRAARAIGGGSGAKATVGIASHCISARLGLVKQGCAGGTMAPQPKQLCQRVNYAAVDTMIELWATEVAQRARELELPLLVVFLTAEQGRFFRPHLRRLGAWLKGVVVAAHLGPQTWLAESRAHGPTENAAAALGLQELLPLPLERSSCTAAPASPVLSSSRADASPQDVVLPAPSPRDWNRDWRGPEGRELLFAWVGENTSPARAHLLHVWGQRNNRRRDILVSLGVLHNYTAILQHSRWCGVPDGSAPWTWRFLDALHCGCVPVVISECWHPPYTRLLSWTQESAPVLFLRPRRIPQLARILESMPPQLWRRKQKATLPFAGFLDPRSMNYHELWMAEVALSQAWGDASRRLCETLGALGDSVVSPARRQAAKSLCRNQSI